ncbi:twin-arginine translocase TatA/TatE family subunit [Psychromonas arctica]|uniref:twin-arginine translocase TatA/TatE family subunit n=1 Tax=Psychromonas arctica TaxID=168275 RepID=UPI002FD396DF
MGGIGIWQLVIIAVIVVLLFGTKKLRGMGGDLGGAIKGFKKAVKDENDTTDLDKKAPESLKAEKSEQKD